MLMVPASIGRLHDTGLHQQKPKWMMMMMMTMMVS